MRHDLNFKPPSLREIIGWESINLDLNLIREILGKKILLTSISETPLPADPIPMALEVFSFLFCEHS